MYKNQSGISRARDSRRASALALLVVILCAIGISCSGCGVYVNPGNDNMYNIQAAQSPWEYTGYLNKQIDAVTNQLSTQVILAKETSDGRYPVADALESARRSARVIQECRDGVDLMLPSTGYEEARLRVLELMDGAKGSVEGYIRLLEASGLDGLEGAAALMQSDYISLTAEFNAYWK